MTPLPDDRTLIYMLADAVGALSKRLYPDEDIFIHPTGQEPSGCELPVGANIVFWGKTPPRRKSCSACST